jgi:hypothetical protein
MPSNKLPRNVALENIPIGNSVHHDVATDFTVLTCVMCVCVCVCEFIIHHFVIRVCHDLEDLHYGLLILGHKSFVLTAAHIRYVLPSSLFLVFTAQVIFCRHLCTAMYV